MKTWHLWWLAAALLTVAVYQGTRASFYRGRADARQEVIDSLQVRADSLAASGADALARARMADARADSIEAEANRRVRADSILIAGLTAQARILDARIASERDRIEPEILARTEPLIAVYAARVAASDSLAATQAARADFQEARADSLVVWGGTWRDVAQNATAEVGVLRDQVRLLSASVDDLNAAHDHSLGFLPEPEWWMVGIGVGAGYLLGR